MNDASSSLVVLSAENIAASKHAVYFSHNYSGYELRGNRRTVLRCFRRAESVLDRCCGGVSGFADVLADSGKGQTSGGDNASMLRFLLRDRGFWNRILAPCRRDALGFRSEDRTARLKGR